MPYNSMVSREDLTNGGLIPVEVSDEILQHVAEDSVVMTYGRRAPDMNAKQRETPVLATLPTAYFVNGDTGLKQTTDISWEKVTLVAEELAVIVPVPEAVLDDANYDIFGQMRPLIQEAFGVAFDQAVLYGTNKPASWPTAIVPEAIARGNNVARGTGTDLYADIFGEGGTIAKVEEDGFLVNGNLAAVSMRAALRGLRSNGATGTPLLETNLQDRSRYSLDGEPIVFPRNGALDPTVTQMISGDWNQLVYAIRQDMTFKMLTEGVIQDNAGAIIYNLAQQDMVALRCVMRVAYQRPIITTRLNSGATRFPFAVLTPDLTP